MRGLPHIAHLLVQLLVCEYRHSQAQSARLHVYMYLAVYVDPLDNAWSVWSECGLCARNITSTFKYLHTFRVCLIMSSIILRCPRKLIFIYTHTVQAAMHWVIYIIRIYIGHCMCMCVSLHCMFMCII